MTSGQDITEINESASFNEQNLDILINIPIKSPVQIQPHHSSDDLDFSSKKFTFDPPLYIQRYEYVSKLLNEYDCKTFLDVGCAECKLLRYIKSSNDKLMLIAGLDLDEDLLISSMQKFTNCTFDFLINSRERPLDLYLIKGDIANPCPYFINKMRYENSHLDFVSLVEIVEHLYPKTLKKCVETVFGMLRPRLVLITTPNSEFNVLFEEEEEKEETSSVKKPKFRHWDHKFEWTRKEFEDWCNQEILMKYSDYKLIFFDGLGTPPSDMAHVGFCTQIAFFMKCSEEPEKSEKCELDEYFREKKRSNIINRDRRDFSEKESIFYLVSDNFTSKKKHEFVPYHLEHKIDLRIEKNLDKNECDYKLITSLSYPFESFDFDNDDQRNKRLVSELNYLITFITSSTRNMNFKRRESIDESNLTDEQQEKVDNDIDLYNDTVYLVSLDQICRYNSIAKFKLSIKELLEIIKSSGYELTKSKKYIIYRCDPDLFPSDDSDIDRDNLEFSSYDRQSYQETESAKESSESEAEFSNDHKFDVCENGTTPNNPNNIIHSKGFFDPNDTWSLEEDWDRELEKSPNKVPKFFTAEEQFEDACQDSTFVESSKSNVVETHQEKEEEGSNLYKSNYYFDKNQNLLLKFRSKQRKVLRQLRKQAFEYSYIEKTQFSDCD